MQSLFAFVVSIAAAATHAVASAEDEIVTLGEIPRISLDKRRPTTTEEAARIKSLIKSLAQIENRDFSSSARLTGGGFIPIGGNQRAKKRTELRELVRIGPKALPYLLDALADTTPTQLKVSLGHKAVIGGMYFENDLSGNPANRFEQEILARTGGGRKQEPVGQESYAVTIGDACFVAIGQIVGRPCEAVRDQPTLCIVINSPTHDKLLREQVQAIWSSSDPDRRVFESLLLDYSTRGVFNGKSLDGWSVGSYLQCSAAMRLLYYYPSAAAQLVAERIAGLDLSKLPEGVDALMKRDVENGVRADDFIRAVTWCGEPVIVEALREARQQATDPRLRELIKLSPKTKR